MILKMITTNNNNNKESHQIHSIALEMRERINIHEMENDHDQQDLTLLV